MGPPRAPQAATWRTSKISATLAEFGTPLLVQLPSGAGQRLREASFEFIIHIWNAHVLAMPVWGQPEILARTRAGLTRDSDASPAPREILQAFEILSAQRARAPFADDPRAIGNWSVRMIDAVHCKLHCDARLPPTLRAPQTGSPVIE